MSEREVKERKDNSNNELTYDYSIRDRIREDIASGKLSSLEEIHEAFTPSVCKSMDKFPKYEKIREYLDTRNPSKKNFKVKIEDKEYVIDYCFEQWNLWIILNDEQEKAIRENNHYINQRVKDIMGDLNGGGVDVYGDPATDNPIVSLLTIQPWHDLNKMLKYLQSRAHDLSIKVYPRQLNLKFYPSAKSGLDKGLIIQKKKKKNVNELFDVSQVDRKRIFDFIDKEHLLGWDNPQNRGSQEFLTLEDDDNVIHSVMTFSPASKSAANAFLKTDPDKGWEATRFVNKEGYHIPGAGGKLLSAWEKLHPELTSVFTYSDCSLSKGDLYVHQGYSLKTIQKGDFKFYSKIQVKPWNNKEIEEHQKIVKYGENLYVVDFMNGKKLKETSLHLQGSDRLMGKRIDQKTGLTREETGFKMIRNPQELLEESFDKEVPTVEMSEYIPLGVDCVCGGKYGCSITVNNLGREILVTNCLISSEREFISLGFNRWADSGNYIYTKKFHSDEQVEEFNKSGAAHPLDELKVKHTQVNLFDLF